MFFSPRFFRDWNTACKVSFLSFTSLATVLLNHRVTRSLPSFPRHSASPIAPTARRGAGRIEPVWKVSPIRSSRYSASLAGASSDEAPSSEGSASSAAGASMQLTRMVEMRRRRMAWILNR